MKKISIGLASGVMVMAFAVSVFASEKGSMMGDEMDKGPSKIEEKSGAWARMSGTAEGSAIKGSVHFHEVEGALKVMAQFSGVTPGKHGIHVHEKGSCEDGGKAAGGHFNPHGTAHGFLPEDGLHAAHAGDMGNILIEEDGTGTLVVELPELSLAGEHGVVGKAVILHEKEDDFGQPTGNAGSRIGCGVIQDMSAVMQMIEDNRSEDMDDMEVQESHDHDYGNKKGSGY